ncbi:hypothetical protein GCM10010231_12400 [Streptomyces sindenensis]|nr:hypothetical protein GCM10010231_12400 [Streptomyces sindenensis]
MQHLDGLTVGQGPEAVRQRRYRGGAVQRPDPRTYDLWHGGLHRESACRASGGPGAPARAGRERGETILTPAE